MRASCAAALIPGGRGLGWQRRLHGHGRAAGQLQGGDRRCTPADHSDAGRSRAERPRRSPSPRSGWCRGCSSSPPRASRVTLALSLHAPDDELRDELVPINTRWNVEEVGRRRLGVRETTKRRVSIEYILIRDVNDQPSRAELLAKVLRRRGSWGWVHVNLIPMNPTLAQSGPHLDATGRGRVRAPAQARRGAGHGARHAWPGNRRGLRATCRTPGVS